MTVGMIYDKLLKQYPLELQMSFDNSGLQLGRKEAKVSKVLLALDVTPQVVDEAISLGVELIISHHPLIFSGLKQIVDNKLLRLCEEKIAVISMHTNLDIVSGGVNDVLMQLFGARVEGVLDSTSCGRVGVLAQEESLQSFLLRCKELLNCSGLRYYDSGRAVKRLAVMGGSGGDCIEDAFNKGCDTYVTADIKYHQFLQAMELGINLIDGDHFCTEDPVIPVLAARLSKDFPELELIVSKVHKQIISFC